MTSTSRSTPCGATPATAAIEAAGRFARHVQVGHIAGPTITLPAPALRSVSLDLRGFRVDLPPPEQRRQGFLDLTRHVAAGDIAVDAEAIPLEQVETAWERQRRAEGGAEARAGSLTMQPPVWNGAGQPRERSPR